MTLPAAGTCDLQPFWANPQGIRFEFAEIWYAVLLHTTWRVMTLPYYVVTSKNWLREQCSIGQQPPDIIRTECTPANPYGPRFSLVGVGLLDDPNAGVTFRCKNRCLRGSSGKPTPTAYIHGAGRPGDRPPTVIRKGLDVPWYYGRYVERIFEE